jgi:glucokinase
MDAAVARPYPHSPTPMQPLMAADVGGTHARVALVRPSEASERAIEILAYRKLDCRDYPGLGEALKSFADDVAIPARHCVLACAGQVVGDEVLHDNLAWPISLSGLRESLAFEDIALLNDFEALGWSLQDPDGLDSRLLCGPDVRPHGPTLVVGPGTGLGAAVHLPEPEPGHGSVLATEAGQMDFAPRTLREREVLASLSPEGSYVPYERIVSGPGLLTLYETLRGLSGKPPALASPEDVSAAARAGSDREAVEAVEMFCGSLGSFAGNLAMVFMAAGGVYLAGGFLSSMFDLLQQSRFVERFLHERSVRAFLERVPVRVMEHGQHGVLGAARWYLGRLARGRSASNRIERHQLRS